MYKGKAPCPGCARTGEEYPRESKASLCWDCKDALRHGRRVLEVQKAMDGVFVRVRIRPRAFQYVYSSRETGTVEWDKNQEFDRLMRDALTSVSEYFALQKVKVTDPQDIPGFRPEDYGLFTFTANNNWRDDVFILPLEIAESWCRLFSLVYEVAKVNWTAFKGMEQEIRSKVHQAVVGEKNKIYNEGVDHGRNLLIQLNEGDITMKTFSQEIKKWT